MLAKAKRLAPQGWLLLRLSRLRRRSLPPELRRRKIPVGRCPAVKPDAGEPAVLEREEQRPEKCVRLPPKRRSPGRRIVPRGVRPVRHSVWLLQGGRLPSTHSAACGSRGQLPRSGRRGCARRPGAG